MQSSIWFLNYEISMLATNVVSSWVLTYKDLVFCWNQTHVYEIYSSVAFKDIGKLMLEVGLMLAHHCDYYGMYYGNLTVPQYVLSQNHNKLGRCKT